MENNGQVSNCGATKKHQKVVLILSTTATLVFSTHKELFVFKGVFPMGEPLVQSWQLRRMQKSRQTTQAMAEVSNSSSNNGNPTSTSSRSSSMEHDSPAWKRRILANESFAQTESSRKQAQKKRKRQQAQAQKTITRAERTERHVATMCSDEALVQ